MMTGTVLAKRAPIWFVVKNTKLGAHLNDEGMQIPTVAATQIASSLLEMLGPDVKAVSIVDRIFYSREYHLFDAALIADDKHEKHEAPVHVIRSAPLGKRAMSRHILDDDIYYSFFIDVYLHVDQAWELSQNTAQYGRFIYGPTIDALMTLLPDENTAVYGLGSYSVGGIPVDMYYDALMFLKPLMERKRAMVYRAKSVVIYLNKGDDGRSVINTTFFNFMDHARCEGMFGDGATDLLRNYFYHNTLFRACVEIIRSLNLPMQVMPGHYMWLMEEPDLLELQEGCWGEPIEDVAEESIVRRPRNETIDEARMTYVKDSAERENTLFCAVEYFNAEGKRVAVSLFHPLMHDDDDFKDKMLCVMNENALLPRRHSERLLFMDNSDQVDDEMARIIPGMADLRPLVLKY